MPVPTPPNKDLFKVTPPKPKMRADSKKLDDQIKKMTANLAAQLDIPLRIILGEKLVEQTKPVVKKQPFVPAEHLTHSPFRDNAELRKLQTELKKDVDPKRPVKVKRNPKRKPATKKTTGVK